MADNTGIPPQPPEWFDYLDEIGDDHDDEEAEAEMNCGSHLNGTCDLAGTEWCDWSCPFSDELRTRRSRRR